MPCTALKILSDNVSDVSNYLIKLFDFAHTKLFIVSSEENDIIVGDLNKSEFRRNIRLIMEEEYFFTISDKKTFIMAPFFADEFTFIHNDKFLFYIDDAVEYYSCPIDDWLDSFETIRSEVDEILG